MKKKILAVVLCVAMLAIMLASGTLAYFTDSQQETNVMTIGDVDIELHEKQKVRDINNDGNLDVEEFQEGTFVLYPISDEQGLKITNKQVDVENIGNEKVYIRTIIAVEDWAKNPTDVKGLCSAFYMSLVDVAEYEDITIDGHNYDVFVCTNKATDKAYAKGEKQFSLQGVYLHKDLTEEQVAAFFGEKVEILVLGQGIQAEGLTHDEAMEQLGEINEENLSEWFDTSDVKGNVIAANP